MHTYLHTYIPTYLHTCIHTYIHTYILTYIYVYIESGQEVVCRFDDGEEEAFDLVIGCDGVKSKVRDQVVGGEESAIYSGKRILFGIAPHTDGANGSRPKEVQGEVHQWFGEGTYTFTTSYGGVTGPRYDQIAVITAADVPTNLPLGRAVLFSATASGASVWMKRASAIGPASKLATALVIDASRSIGHSPGHLRGHRLMERALSAPCAGLAALSR